MKYIPKPAQPVEAVRNANIAAALDFLRDGEFTVIAADYIVVRWNDLSMRAYFNNDYLVRDDKGVRPIPADEFEACYQEAK